MATIVQVYDQKELKTVKVEEIEDSDAHREAAAVAACKMTYDDESRYTINVLHGPSIKAIKEHHVTLRT